MMLNRRVMPGVVLIAVALALVWLRASFDAPRAAARRGNRLTPAHMLNNLSACLARTDPASPAAAALRRDIARVRRKAAVQEARLENPGAFLEALAELKTGPDGRTYPLNYKMRALRRAGAFDRRGRLRKVAAADVLPWVERGPGNVSGRARAVIVDRSDPAGNSWFVATVGGGVWHTADAGVSWRHITPGLTTLSTMTIVQAPSNPDVLYVGTGMGYGRIVDLEGSGIWKSVDHGETWQQLESSANGQILAAVNRLVVDPQDENIVLACTNDGFSHLGPEGGTRRSGIFRSEDGGQRWAQVFDADAVFGDGTDNRVQQILANPENFNTLYASVNEVGVIKSVDAGHTWFVSADNFALPSDIGNPTGNGFGLAGISVRTELAIAPTDTARLYAAVERPRGIADLYMSADAGASWVLVDDTSGDPNWFNAFANSGASGSYTAGWFDNTIAVHPYDANIVFVGGVNLYRLQIDPASATRTSTLIALWLRNQGVPFAHADHHFLAIIPGNPETDRFRILDANDGGLAVSNNNGNNWSQLAGIGSSQFYAVDKKPGSRQYIGGMQDNSTYMSPPEPDAGSRWTFETGGDGFEAAWHAADPNLLLASSQFGNYFRSTDGGRNWRLIPDAKPGSAPFISKIAYSKSDPDLVFTIGFEGVKRSDDFGATWTLTPVQGNWLGYRPFDNIEISLADPQVVWISSRLDVDPPSGLRGGIHVSTDGGLRFTEISANFPPTVREASGLGTHPADPATAYFLFAAPGAPKVLRTRDFGRTWEDLSQFDPATRKSRNGFPDVAVFTLLVMPFNTDILWAGTEIGLFVSDDGGRSWRFAENGLPNVAIFELKIVDGQILAATQGRGVWTLDLPELADYTLAAVTLAPRLRNLALEPSGGARVAIDLRSPYDSTVVWQESRPLRRFGANAEPRDTTFVIPIAAQGNLTVSLTAYRDGRPFKSPAKTIEVYPAVARERYASDLNAAGAADDFAGDGFTVTSATGFTSPAIHSTHPYTTNAEFVYQLKVPIRVAPAPARMQYDDVAIVEEGTDDFYTDPNFWDYVIVEGTRDGIDWLPLLDGYDSRANARWSAAYNAGRNGDGSMFVTHTVDLLETFAPGDVILIRFRLFSDTGAVGWGWAIDNIRIQTEDENTEPPPPPVPTVFELGRNFPNPFNPRTTIGYDLPQEATVDLRIYNTTGQQVRELVIGKNLTAGRYSAVWDGRNDSGRAVASGIYFYRLIARAGVASAFKTLFEKTHAMTLLR